MASKTKGFFEKEHGNKRTGSHWNRNQQNRAPLNETPANIPIAAAKPPIPANSQATSKLQAFSFTEKPPGQREGAVSTETGNSSSETNTAFPCTPGARLPLEDLIGDCDEVKKVEEAVLSPQEQIGWIPNGSSETPNRRKRKRAKSSSPTGPASSSQPGGSTQKGQQSVSKTPAADPSVDLWQRYASSKQSGDTPQLPEISNLVFQGSPRPLETPVKGGGLRRWASTGNDWPTSKNKRQRTGGSRTTTISVWQDQTAVDSGGRSKVATMVQKLQESLATQRLEQARNETPTAKAADLPSSSSPLPETNDSFTKPQTTSPLQARMPALPQPRPPTQTLRPTLSGRIRYDTTRQTGDPLNPSAAPTYSLQSKAPLPAYKRPSIVRPPSLPKVPQVVKQPAPIAEADEFGDEDFDLTVDDLDELCTQPAQNQRQQPISPHPMPPSSQAVPPNAPGRPAEPGETITIEDDDEFGDDGIDEDSFAQAEFSATQAMQISSRKRSPRKGLGRSPRKATQASARSQADPYAPKLQRYFVKQVMSGDYTNDKGRRCDEIVILAEDERKRIPAVITLRGSWTTTPVSPKAILHVAHIRSRTSASASTSPPGQIVISDDEHSPMLIVHPDHMLSATTIADSFDCIRKAVLQDRIKATSEGSKAMVYGSMLHEIFQQALSANQWSETYLADLVERTIQGHVEGLWELGMVDTNLAAEEVKAKMGEITAWASIFVQSEPSAAAQVDDKQGEKVLISISKLIAIEEHVWSPQYGLKGNVDATVEATIASRPGAPNLQKLIVPFEVKTGRTTQSAAHRAQTALYTLLMSDRYDVVVEAGILYYLESSAMSRIAPPLNEIRQMIQQRNRLAAYIFRARHPVSHEDALDDGAPPPSQQNKDSGLPPMLRNPYKCGRCYAQQSCFSYHALVENGNAESAGMIDDNKKNHSLTWKEAMGHLLLEGKDIALGAATKKWFTKWDKLLTLEEGDQARFRKELWTMSSMERESAGRCFGRLHLVKDMTAISTATQVDGVEGSGGKINRFAYGFARAQASPGASFTEGSQLTMGEPIVVSSEQGQWALANGYVVGLSRSEITVAVDRKLGGARRRLADFDEKNNQAFQGTMTVGGIDNDHDQQVEPVLYRIDKDEFSNGLALVRNNLVALVDNSPIVNKLRDQIIFNAAPIFTPTPAMHGQFEPTQLGQMNEDQRSAVTRVLAADDYALILGMPGTGKTTTIANIIRALLAEDKSILLTSYTHTAVDNILLKIKDIAPPGSILRLGVPAKINPQVQEFCQLAATPRKSIEEVDAAYMGTKIVATTCMGTNHALFHRRSFDVCIVDEASQITLPTILGPLLHARKFVLVGDHFQLPPLVQNKRALEGGLDVSLFRQLSENHPGAVAELGRQYRMCEEIMSLSNELIYHGKLRCGTEVVAQRTLHLSNPKGLQVYHNPHATCLADSACWLSRATEPGNKVVFANTDALNKMALETLSGGGKITNLLEATLSAQLVLSFLTLGVPASEIGVITLYRSQLALMRQLFRRAGIPATVEIDSADRFQGRDKEVVILSMVRSNESGLVGDLLKDWRRVNVALTRAKSKLVVLGSRRTLKNNELLDKMITMMDDNGWILELPSGADNGHAFDFSTQVAASLVEASPRKRSPQKSSPRKRVALESSRDAGNRSPSKKKSPKVVKGQKLGSKARKVRDEVVMEIWEDMTGEEF